MAISVWNMHGPESTTQLAAWAEGEVELDAVECATNPGHRRAGRRLTDLSVVLPNQVVEDVVWTWHGECLVQEWVVNCLREHGLTRFETRPVRARFEKSSRDAPILRELVVTGWGGLAGPESGIVLSKRCSTCGLLRYTACTNPERLIRESEWDGSDLFIVWPLPKFIFVSERFVTIIREKQVSGVFLRRPADLRLSGGFGPGRLSYRMPARRAVELGAPLGID